MRLLCSGDWQCRIENLSLCEQTVQHLIELGKKHKVDGYVILGDQKHVLNPVDLRVNNFLVKAVQDLKYVAAVYVLRGNHDAATTQDDSPSCLPLMEAAGATVFDQVSASVWRNNLELCFVPFRRDKEGLKKLLNDIPKRSRSEKRILFFHEEIRGCRMNTMIRSSGGLTLDDLHPERYDVCIGGHIHFQQLVSENVWYAGSPFCHDWGEVNQQKGFLLIEVGNKKTTVTSIPSRIPGWYDPALPNFPKHNLEKDARVRIRVPSNASPAQITKAEQMVKQVMPGTIITVQKEHEEEEPVTVEGALGNTDLELLRSYLQQTVAEKQIEPMLAYLQKRITGRFAVGIQGLQLLSVGATETLCFEKCTLDLSKPGLTLVTGKNEDWGEGRSNGAGKSTILSLPALALFGKTLKEQTHDQWRRNGAEEPTIVTLLAKLPDGKEVCVQRGRKPGFLKLLVGGKDVSMGDANQTQRAIEETTGLTWDVFTNSIYIGQYEVTTLLYGTDKQRKELFSRFLGLERFIKTQERIRADVRKNQDEQSSLRNQVEIAKGRAEELDSAVVLADKAIGTKQAKPDYEVDLARREVRKLNDEIAHLDNWLRVNQSQFEISLDSGYKADAAKEQAERQLTKLDDIPGKCPTCGAVMSIKTREKHEHELRKEIAEQEILSEAFEAEKSKNRKQRKPKMDRLQACRLRIRDIQNLEVEHKLWSQAEVQRKEQQRLLQEAKARRKDWLEKAKAHEALLEELCDSQRFLEACLKAVSREGLPSYLCSTVCGRLNAATRRYSDLFTEGEIRVRFKIEAGELDLELVNAHGGIGLRDQSMGELRLAALIAIFAFRELLVPCNVLFLDEPLEGVDSVGAYRIGALLNEVCKRVGGSIFLTTHNPHLLSGLEPARHLEIVKRNGVSTVKEIQ